MKQSIYDMQYVCKSSRSRYTHDISLDIQNTDDTYIYTYIHIYIHINICVYIYIYISVKCRTHLTCSLLRPVSYSALLSGSGRS